MKTCFHAALEVPGPLQGLSVKKIREKLTKHKLYSYTFRVSFEGNHKNAIKVLQQSLNLSVTGRYTEDVARAVYEKVKGDIKKGQGYLASEDDPDRLFKSGFQEYVFCVDKVVWGLCGIEEKFLADDGGTVWKHDQIDETCRELLGMVPEIPTIPTIPVSLREPDPFRDSLEASLPTEPLEKMKIKERLKSIGREEVTIGPSEPAEIEKVKGCLEQIQEQAQVKAREILDEILDDVVFFATISQRRRSRGYELNEEAVIYSYEYDVSVQSNIRFLLQYGMIPLLIYAGHPDAVKLAQIGGAAAIPAYTELGISAAGMLMDGGPTVLGTASSLAGQGDSLLLDQSPSLVSIYDMLVDDPDFNKVLNAQWQKSTVTTTEWNYLINGSWFGHVRNVFIRKVEEKINSLSDTTYIFSDSYWENSLYNKLIRDYLEDVRLLNVHHKESEKILSEWLH